MPTDVEPSTRRRFDPLVAVVAGIALLVYALHGRTGYLSRDLGLYSYAGQQVADGVPPYVGVLNRAGPLAHLLPAVGAVGARIVGVDDLVGMRVLFLLISVATVAMVYVVGRNLFGSRAAGLVSASTFLCFYGFVEYASNGPREKTPMVLFLVCVVWALGRRRWFLAGVFLGLATLVLQIAFFVGAPLVAVALIAGLRRGALLRAAGRVILGGLAPLAVASAYFLVVGAFRDFVDAYVVINLRYTTSSPVTAAGLADNWHELADGYGASVWLMPAGLVALLVLGVMAIRRRGLTEDPNAATVVGLAAAAVVGSAWTLRDFDGWPDAFPLLPLAALGVGGVIALIPWRVPGRGWPVVPVVWSAAAVCLALTLSLTRQDDRLDLQRASVRATLAELPDDATILSIHAPQPLVLSGKTNPTRNQMFSNGLSAYVDDTWEGGMPGFRQDMLNRQPTLIALGRPGRKAWAKAFASDYQRIGCPPGWVWYANKSLGEEKLARLVEVQPKKCGEARD